MEFSTKLAPVVHNVYFLMIFRPKEPSAAICVTSNKRNSWKKTTMSCGVPSVSRPGAIPNPAWASSLGIIDSQSVKGTRNSGESGYDAGKKSKESSVIFWLM